MALVLSWREGVTAASSPEGALVGVLFQTMYLPAAVMRLAPCALGGGDADLFARAAGTDYRAETSVGEFLLGSRRRGPMATVGEIRSVLAGGPSDDLPSVDRKGWA